MTKEAIEQLKEIRSDYESDCNNSPFKEMLYRKDIEAIDLAIKALEERQQGEWIKDEFGRKICGKCQFPFAEFQSDNYCSLCGAKMKGDSIQDG